MLLALRSTQRFADEGRAVGEADIKDIFANMDWPRKRPRN